ncbi:MAG TPA: phosphatidylglycerophosphatase A [Bacteroidota bacterium]|nr:phosphatidylglycerophosphatase A [Bacteroidota bacterium]
MPSQTGSPNPDGQGGPQGPRTPPFLVRAFASGLFSGYSPIASGTVGSLVGLAFYWIPGFEQPYYIMPASVIVFLAGIKAGDIMEQYYGHDPAEVTIDEVLGMWFTLFLLPKSVVVAVAGFFVFRILDIVKPFPAKKFDAATGGFGIMMDDVVSAFYSNLILQLVFSIPFFRHFI